MTKSEENQSKGTISFCIRTVFPPEHELRYTWGVLSSKLVGRVLNTGFCCSWWFVTGRKVCLMPSLQKLHHRIVLAKLNIVKYDDKLTPFVLWRAELQEVQLTAVTQVAQAFQCHPVEAKTTAEMFHAVFQWHTACFPVVPHHYIFLYSLQNVLIYLQIKVCTEICKPLCHLLRWVNWWANLLLSHYFNVTAKEISENAWLLLPICCGDSSYRTVKSLMHTYSLSCSRPKPLSPRLCECKIKLLICDRKLCI